MIRRARMTAVLAFLLTGAVGLISSTQTWVIAHRTDAVTQLDVAGADAMPLLAPLSLAVLALGAALSIAGRVVQYVFAVLAAAGAVTLILSTVPLVLDPPLSSVAASVTEVTGLSGDEALREVVEGVSATGWPAVALALWVLLLLASAFVLATAHRWRRGSERHRATSTAHHHTAGPLDPVDSWDELSHGTDPTD